MRTTVKMGYIALGLAALTATRASAQVRQSGMALTHTLTAVVQPFVRVVVLPPASGQGAPVMRVVTNDPRLRAAYLNAVNGEVVTPAEVEYQVTGRANGGAAALPGEAVATPAVERFTIVMP